MLNSLKWKRLLMGLKLAILCAFVVPAIACDKDPGDHLEDAAENVGDAVEDVGDAVRDAAN